MPPRAFSSPAYAAAAISRPYSITSVIGSHSIVHDTKSRPNERRNWGTHLPTKVQCSLTARKVPRKAAIHRRIDDLRELDEHQSPDLCEDKSEMVHGNRHRERLEVARVMNLALSGVDEWIIGRRVDLDAN